MSSFVFLTDVEGPLANPGQDNAKDILAHMGSLGLMESPDRKMIEGPADNTDDNRHRREKFLHNPRRARWSTGTTPGTVQCYAAMVGLKDEDIYGIAMDKFLLNDGAPQLLEFVKKRCARIGLATTAHPSVSLTIGRDYHISSSDVWSLGYRPSREKLEEFDRNPNVLAEIGERSIIRRLSPYQNQLKRFMPIWIRNNVEWDETYERGDEPALRHLDEELDNLFVSRKGTDYSPEFVRMMRDILINKSCLMGAHQKGQVVFEMSRYGKPIVVGDSIVDDLMLLYAQALGGVGIAVNDTNDDSLSCAAISIATPDMGAVRDVLELVMVGKYDTRAANRRVRNYDASVFSLLDYKSRPLEVIGTHGETKNHLRKVVYTDWLRDKPASG